ncbi:hypothetical protein CBM2586_A10003 [Cupriavidus phytorum]|uniref:Uncharacterized protein n=1 Tax=Cupriavidus taiwanensis TaxID=164546 RepID=A0A375B8P2_9BURK|nr:hypothetical protein CBM2586_A10003 [Cupriavidus taiwanensis]
MRLKLLQIPLFAPLSRLRERGRGRGPAFLDAWPLAKPPLTLPSPHAGRGNTIGTGVSSPYACASVVSPGFTYIECFGCDSTRRTIGSKNDSGSVS